MKPLVQGDLYADRLKRMLVYPVRKGLDDQLLALDLGLYQDR